MEKFLFSPGKVREFQNSFSVATSWTLLCFSDDQNLLPKKRNWPRERTIYSWLRHCGMCCTLKKRQLPNITGGRTPCQGCLEVLDLPCRKGWPSCAHAHAGNGAAHFSRKVPIGTYTHVKSATLRALSFFSSRPRDISGRALVTGYASDGRQANFWQSSTAPRCATETRANFLEGHRTNR